MTAPGLLARLTRRRRLRAAADAGPQPAGAPGWPAQVLASVLDEQAGHRTGLASAAARAGAVADAERILAGLAARGWTLTRTGR